MTSENLTLFNRYDVGCELGKGTYGIVRKAFDTRQQHHVAIKCVCLGEEGIPSTALREISLLRSLKHANIIRLYDIQVHQPTGELFLFYECMEMDLYEYMKLYRQPLPDALSKSYLKQMLLGIDYIHCNSMLHRDLKPQNSEFKEHLSDSFRSLFALPRFSSDRLDRFIETGGLWPRPSFPNANENVYP